jgi:hypothetical protein
MKDCAGWLENRVGERNRRGNQRKKIKHDKTGSYENKPPNPTPGGAVFSYITRPEGQNHPPQRGPAPACSHPDDIPRRTGLALVGLDAGCQQTGPPIREGVCQRSMWRLVGLMWSST